MGGVPCLAVTSRSQSDSYSQLEFPSDPPVEDLGAGKRMSEDGQTLYYVLCIGILN